ncbi:MAG: hypothetical protein ACRDD8_14200 [Bacteroidales bacterium]
MEQNVINNANMIPSNVSTINILDFDTVKCENCGCLEFKQITIIKKVPIIYQGALNREYVDVLFYKCCECGKIFNEMPDAESVYNELISDTKPSPQIIQPNSIII